METNATNSTISFTPLYNGQGTAYIGPTVPSLYDVMTAFRDLFDRDCLNSQEIEDFKKDIKTRLGLIKVLSAEDEAMRIEGEALRDKLYAS